MINRLTNNIFPKKKYLYLYLLGLTIFFIFTLFPGEAVREAVERRGENIHPDFEIKISGARLSPFLWLVLKDGTLNYKSAPLLQAEYFKARPTLSTIWGQSGVSFKAPILEGSIRGKCRHQKDQGLSLAAGVKKINIGKWLSVQKLWPYEITGIISGRTALENVGQNAQGEASFSLSEARLTLPDPLLGISHLDFASVETSLTLEKGRVTLTEFNFKGPQVSGEFTGKIIIRQPYEKSSLDLKGFLKPQADFMAELGKSVPVELFIKKSPDEKGFGIKISGTMADPKLSLNP